jgi:hypothetical protein
MSLRTVAARPASTSGAQYCKVPTIFPATESGRSVLPQKNILRQTEIEQFDRAALGDHDVGRFASSCRKVGHQQTVFADNQIGFPENIVEELAKVAVLAADAGIQKLYGAHVTVSDFVKWLRSRYGILIDSTGETNDSPDIARALEVNYTALKDRLRQLGFFTDLSDASISQVIKPRFPITVDSEHA